MSKDSNAKIFSVVGGCRRSGRWLVPAKTKMMTLFGRAVIDLRQAQTSAEEIEFTCMSVFANITFLVPEGAEVRPSGMAIFGSSRSMVPISDVPCDLPPMSIDATTVFGRLRVRTTEIDPEDKPPRRRSRRRGSAQPVPTLVAAPSTAQTSAPQPAPEPAPRRTDDDEPEVSPIHNVEVPDSIGDTAADEVGEAPESVTDDPEPPAVAQTDAAESVTDDPEPVAADT